MEESEIVKFICANQGSVNTDELLYNVCCGGSIDTLSNRDKFALCCLKGQPKVLARTRLRLCRKRDCPWTCGGLHLCANVLLSGSCSRTVCSFCHELDSAYNKGILKQHELESLSRAELCTLLLQSDYTLLPPICHDYNNQGDGEFGRCKSGNDCKRLHVCERYLSGDCSCFRTHDFHAPQPLKVLRSKCIPDTLMSSLKSVYVNKEAIRTSDYATDSHGNTSRQKQRNPRCSTGDNFSDESSDGGLNFPQTEWYRGKGNRGDRGTRDNRGNRGNRRNRGNQSNLYQQHRASSTSDILASIDDLDLYSEDGQSEDTSQQQEPNSATSDPADDSNKDFSWDDGPSRRGQQCVNRTARGRGGHQGNRGKRGGNRGNRGNSSNLKERACSTSDIGGLDHSTDDGRNRSHKTPSSNDMCDASDNRPNNRPRPVREKTEICLFFIKGHCIHNDDKCFKVHHKLPYRWEVREGYHWTALPENEAIERDYCDPQKTQSCSTPPVQFDTMTCGQNNVRRLSTSNSLVEPTFMYTTEWIWYWQDDSGKWNMYASPAGGHESADIDGTKLEQQFLIDDKAVVEFTAGSQSYSLSFQDMKQRNKQYGTERHVRRRPYFVSVEDVITKRVRRPKGKPNFFSIPLKWDKTQLPETGYRRVSLQSSSDEFKEVESLFCKTMRGFDIVSIERIQNKALWEVFQWQKTQMKNRNGGQYAKERKLFHGTDSKHVDAICLTNFDWRICGTHGTAYGKGSYFARDAKYSHSYTSDSGVKSLFVSCVLVGDYTRGSSHYCRPPSKDGGDVNFYDSCVDDVRSPSIFVVFEKHQIYPEYLLQYSASAQPSVSPYTPSTSVKPSVSPYTPSTPVKPSVSSYTPSTPAQPSVSPYTPSASAQPSVSPYTPSTSVKPSVSPYTPSTPVKPSVSSYTPSASAQPSVSPYTPSTSVKPSVSSYTSRTSAQPSSLHYNPSTGSYHYKPSNPAEKYDFSLPKPKKNSDSCVIV